MELLTNSSRSLYQSCPRKFFFMHEQGYIPVKEHEALAFGKIFHSFLEALFSGKEAPVIPAEINPYTAVILTELLTGYKAKWQQIKADAVECEYVLPLLNPATAAASRTFELAGKIDAIVGDAVVEHKTTSDSIEDPSCEYWQRLSLDSQISGYFLAAEKLGYKPTKVIYDVIKKPQIRPLKATPVEKRKYTKKDGKLYADQRETDETPEEFAARLREDIATNPDKYFQRREIARLESDLTEYMQDLWSVAKLIMESRSENYWPKRISQCFSYGRCPYYEVCAKIASLDDESMYTKSDNKNPELSKEIFNGSF